MIDVYVKDNCPYCVQAKNMLNRHGQMYREIPIGPSGILKEELLAQFPNAKTAPVIVIDGEFIGGYAELFALMESNPVFLTE